MAALIEILESLRASKVEKKAFVFGVQVGDTFRSHDLFSELEDLMIGKGVVKRDETGRDMVLAVSKARMPSVDGLDF